MLRLISTEQLLVHSQLMEGIMNGTHCRKGRALASGRAGLHPARLWECSRDDGKGRELSIHAPDPAGTAPEQLGIDTTEKTEAIAGTTANTETSEIYIYIYDALHA